MRRAAELGESASEGRLRSEDRSEGPAPRAPRSILAKKKGTQRLWDGLVAFDRQDNNLSVI
ncbi:hypothetical protein SAMN06295998_12143 [Primorskyibacter flagellatus]|uniref:Uncharacterized protein n=1 Tax=Primorskyibacter flagellatus TaxID=1387277 RepID=A0A1W2E476_9RHOB|nr:hypothetical protein SAMN06295998_12143 [Primorskyibacter flagellatus]